LKPKILIVGNIDTSPNLAADTDVLAGQLAEMGAENFIVFDPNDLGSSALGSFASIPMEEHIFDLSKDSAGELILFKFFGTNRTEKSKMRERRHSGTRSISSAITSEVVISMVVCVDDYECVQSGDNCNKGTLLELNLLSLSFH